MIVLLRGPVNTNATAPKGRACQFGALPPMPHSSALVPRTPAFSTSGIFFATWVTILLATM